MANAVNRIVVELIAKTNGATAGFKQAGAEADRLNRQVGVAGSGISGRFKAIGGDSRLMGMAVGGGAALAAVGIARFAMKAGDAYVNLAGQVREFSRVAGGTSEDASRLVFAFKRVGVAPEGAAKALTQLSKRLGAGQVDLARFGIQVKRNEDGSINMKDAVLQLSDALSGMDANKRAATVFELFGRQGATLLPLLTKNREEIQAIFKLADEDHQILSDEDLEKAKQYKATLAELDLAFQGIQVAVGQAVLPLMQDLADAMQPLARFASDNTEAMKALALIIGGPLAVGLGALGVAKLGGAAINGLRLLGSGIGFVTSGMLDLAAKVVPTTIAMEGFAVAEGEVAAANAAVTASNAGLLASFAGIAAAATDAVIAVSALNPALLGAVLADVYNPPSNQDKAEEERTKRAKAFVREGLAANREQGKSYAWLKWNIAAVGAEIDKTKKRIDKTPPKPLWASWFGDTNNLEQLQNHLWAMQKRMDVLRTSFKHFQKEAHKAGFEVKQASAEIAGLHVKPDALAGLDAKELKDFAKNITDARTTFGDFRTQMLLDSGLTSEALKALTADTNAVLQAMTGAFQGATTVVGAFGEDTKITGDEFMKKLGEQRDAAWKWANELKLAAALGVDNGLLQEIAAAGPKAEPELAGLLDAVRTHGVDAVNQTKTDIGTALDSAKDTIAGRAAEAGVAGAVWGQAAAEGASNAFITKLQGDLTRFFAGLRLNPFGGGDRGGFYTWGRGVGNNSGTAGGGFLHAGQAMTVGEVGPEVFVPGSAGQILPNVSTFANATATRSGSDRGGNTYSITVHSVAPSATVGRDVVRAIQEYERGSGKRWRNN